MSEMKKRANSVYSFAILDGKPTWDFGDLGRVAFDLDKVSAVNRARAMVHGFVQRANDSMALSRNTENGASATAEEKMAELKRVVEHYESGSDDWNIRAAASGERSVAGTAFWVAKALVRLGKAKDETEASTKIQAVAAKSFKGDMKAAWNAYAADKTVALAIVDLKAEAAAARPAAIDVMAALDELA